MHYYKFNIADWGLSTAHLTLEEEAIYFRLVNHYYDTEKPIPLETQLVFRRLRMETQQETALAILGEFFELTDDGWFHDRCEKNLKEYRKTARKNKANGAKGGRPRKDAASKETQSVSGGLPEESQKNPNQEPLTNNQEPITNVEGENRKRFVPPTQIEVEDFFNEKGWSLAKLEAEKFVNFYSSKNWYVGKNKMKIWKGAAANWMARANEKQEGFKSSREKAAQRNAEIFDYNKATTW